MSTIVDFLEVLAKLDGLISAIIASVATFLITQYTYNKNIPLDKLEISYNRIYYPIYCLIRNNNDVMQIVEKSEKYLLKYSKYVDGSTWESFEFLKKNLENKDAYNTYKSNISDMNCKLRRRLGYLEPNILTVYTYLPSHKRFIVRVMCELVIVYSFVMILTTVVNETIKAIFLALSIIFVIVLVADTIGVMCDILCKKIMRKIRSKQKKK